MKKALLIIAISLVIISCKKEKTVITPITGTWYYQQYKVNYFDNNGYTIFVDTATPQINAGNPSYTFNEDGTGNYGGTPFNYSRVRTASTDSLIFNDFLKRRYEISFDTNGQLILHSSKFPETTGFRNTTTGDYIESVTANTYGVFGRQRVTL